ncbi:MAG: ATP-binding cassette domain-containing protein [Candidatus Zixiibacteriota bacterium]|nr:MAG: ATP-binding cassette domain-containing protein [candidate division Zixibacteria bacterium]
MIDVNNISVIYKSGDKRIPALSSLSLNIEDGAYISILGPNGSGKSTLVKALCGLVPLADGCIEIFGKRVLPGAFSKEFFGKVGVVFQEPSGQFLMPTVKKEIESPLQNMGLSYLEQQKIFDEIIERFELINILHISPENLSPGQMQIINLAVAFSIGSDILILDEPTTFLDLKFRRLFLEYVHEINNEGRTIIHITQYPDEALFSKKTAIMDSGRLVAVGDSYSILSDREMLNQFRLSPPREIEFKKYFGFDFDDSEAINSFIGSLRRSRLSDSIPPEKNMIVISAGDLSFSYPAGRFLLKIEEMYLYENQIAGLIGPSGSGKSTLALLLAGILQCQKGVIKYFDKKISDVYEYRKIIGLSWQMPDPVLIGPTVQDDLLLSLKFSDEQDLNINSLLESVGLAGFGGRIVDTLSGGEKRKLSLATVLAAKPEFLVLDEPAAFLDPASQNELKNIIKEILRKVKGALIVSHDLSFLSDLAERIIGLNNGKIAFDLPAEKFFSYPEYSRSIDLDVDKMITFRNKIAEIGLELSCNSLDPKTIKEILKKSPPAADDFS